MLYKQGPSTRKGAQAMLQVRPVQILPRLTALPTFQQHRHRHLHRLRGWQAIQGILQKFPPFWHWQSGGTFRTKDRHEGATNGKPNGDSPMSCQRATLLMECPHATAICAKVY